MLKQPRSQLIQAFKALLKKTQALLEAQAITEAEIADEIEAYRVGQ